MKEVLWNVPKASELLYPIISIMFFKNVRDNLHEFRPIFNAGPIAWEPRVAGEVGLLKNSLRKEFELSKRRSVFEAVGVISRYNLFIISSAYHQEAIFTGEDLVWHYGRVCSSVSGSFLTCYQVIWRDIG